MSGAAVMNPVGQTGPTGPTGATGPAGSSTTGYTSSTAAVGNDQRLNTVNPAVNGFLMWTADLSAFSAGVAVSTGLLRFVKVYMPSAATFNNLYMWATAAASGLTLAEMGIYNSGGTLVASSGNVYTAWNSATGLLTAPLTSSYAWAGGSGAWFYLAVLCVGTTAPTALGATAPAVNANVSAGTYRVAYESTATFPTTVTLSGLSASTSFYWMGAA